MATWIAWRDRRRRLRVVPFQQAPRPPMTPALASACARAMHVVTTEGEVLRGGRAALFCFEHMGWGGAARVLRLPPLAWLVELGYALFVAHRSTMARLVFRRPYPLVGPGRPPRRPPGHSSGSASSM